MDGFAPEQKFVAETFQTSFAAHRADPIVLYGIGKNTEAVLLGTQGFCFAGLMDQATTGKTVYGQKVLSDAEVIRLHPIVVIIARQSVVNVIFKRIRYLATEHGIPVYDFQGNLLGEENQRYSNEGLPYWNASAQELMDEIRRHDIITFDIFDTLLMRRTLLPSDVWELAEQRLRAEGHACPFAAMRREAEASLKDAPDLDAIYAEMAKRHPLGPALLRHMQETECALDASLLLRRERMCQIFRFALAEGKTVYLLSDMYYTKAQLTELLRRNGIEGHRDLIVSCEVKREKADGALFRWLRAMAGAGSILHIGDNRRADIEMARANGLDAYQILSAYELLMASSLQDLLVNVDTLQKRCLLGLAIARLFNDPFVLHGTHGYLPVTDMQALGYGFVAPMLVEFTRWFHRKAEQHGIEQILLPSRDGYLMEKLYKILFGSDIETVYFRASRRAATVAGLADASDIEGIASRGGYRGTCEQLLKARFGIDMQKTDPRRTRAVREMPSTERNQLLKDYEGRILENAEKERKGYVGYLQKKGLMSGKKQALFDFVAGGTVQYYLSRILHNELKGLYFATMDLPNHMYSDDQKEIETAYGNFQYYGMQNQISKHFLVLESILVDDKNSFSHIGPAGEEVFESAGAGAHYPEIKKLQDAALEYARDYMQCFAFLRYGEEELTFADTMFGMPFSKRCLVDKKVKDAFVNEGVYDGEKTYSVWNED